MLLDDIFKGEENEFWVFICGNDIFINAFYS